MHAGIGQRRIGQLGLRAQAVDDAGDHIARPELAGTARTADADARMAVVGLEAHVLQRPVAVVVTEQAHVLIDIAGTAGAVDRVAARQVALGRETALGQGQSRHEALVGPHHVRIKQIAAAIAVGVRHLQVLGVGHGAQVGPAGEPSTRVERVQHGVGGRVDRQEIGQAIAVEIAGLGAGYQRL
jgi:hypothetical protein